MNNRMTTIEARGPLLDLKLRELWNYRDLVLLMVRRDFVTQYKQTILGPVWHLLQPLLTTIIFTVVFGKVAQLPTDGIPPFVFYMAGTITWSYFANIVTSTSNTFAGNAHIFGKVYFPRLAMPLATVLSKLIAFSIQFVFFLCVLAWYAIEGAPVGSNEAILLTPLLLLLLASFALGAGLCVSALTTRYRDLAVVVGFGVQSLMYLSPVVYPISMLPADWQKWALANPIAPVLEAFRFAYTGAGKLDWVALVYSGAVILIVLAVGLLLFNRVERTFMDTI